MQLPLAAEQKEQVYLKLQWGKMRIADIFEVIFGATLKTVETTRDFHVGK